MSSRVKIFNRLSQSNKIPFLKPKPLKFSWQSSDLVNDFTQALNLAGGNVVVIDNTKELQKAILEHFSYPSKIVDTRKELLEGELIDRKQTWDLAIIEAKLGVAENGALWVEWSEEYPRSIITLSKNLALTLPSKKIVSNMQEAYSKIDLLNISYGTFLAGPSKTADIEQSLVIGAHGAVGLTLFLI